MRVFFDDVVFEDAQAREEDGKRPSQSVLDKMAYVLQMYLPRTLADADLIRSEKNIHAMRMGPGKHLQGKVLMDGLVKPEEVSVIVFKDKIWALVQLNMSPSLTTSTS